MNTPWIGHPNGACSDRFAYPFNRGEGISHARCVKIASIF